MSYSFLVTAKGIADTSFTTNSVDTTGANLIVAADGYYQGAAPLSFVDNKGNTYSNITTALNDGLNGTLDFWYKQAPTVGSGHNWSVSGTGDQYSSVVVAAFSGSAASPLDQQSFNVNGFDFTTIQPGSVTPSQANELVITAAQSGAAEGSITYPTGYTGVDKEAYASDYGVSLAYKIQTSAGAENPTWTFANNIPAVAGILTFKAAGAATLSYGWLATRDAEPTRTPARRRNLESAAALSLTPATLPPLISGMSWFEPRDTDRRSATVKLEAPSAIAFEPFLTPGIGWFDPRDSDRRSTYLRIEAPPGISLTPATLPVPISGIAWFEPRDADNRSAVTKLESPSAISFKPFLTPGIGWFEPRDTDQRSSFARIESPPSAAPMPDTLPVPISGIAWFEPCDTDRRSSSVKFEAPPGVSLTPATLPVPIGGMAWFEPRDRDVPVKRQSIEAPLAFHFALPIVISIPISGMAWFEPRDDDKRSFVFRAGTAPAIALTPGTLPVGISGVAWFEPRDRDKPALPVKIESVPAMALMPVASLVGVSWFEPPDRDRPASPVKFESIPGLLLLPGAGSVSVSGIAWFEPPDKDKPASPIRIGLPSAALLMAIAPPVPISGIGWFEPPDRNMPARAFRIEAPPAIDMQIIATAAYIRGRMLISTGHRSGAKGVQA